MDECLVTEQELDESENLESLAEKYKDNDWPDWTHPMKIDYNYAIKMIEDTEKDL